MTAAVAAVAAATVGYTIGVLTSRNGNVPAPTPEKKMKSYKGQWVEVKDEGPSDFSIDSGDAKKGAKLFKAKCATCHAAHAGGGTKQGPNLYGIMGTKAASAKDFKFTKNLKKAEVEWNNETMFAWLANPKLFVKGTSMAFAGFKKEEDRADVIAYLNTLNPDAPPLKGH